MKVLAAVSIRQYEQAVESLAEYTRTIEMGLQVVLREQYIELPTQITSTPQVGAIVFGSDPNALGYFGLAYYEKRPKELKAVAIDSGKGSILPSRETVVKAEYHPLARPLFIYVNAEKAQKNTNLKDFIDFYLNNAETIVAEVGYIPLTEEHYHLSRVTFYNGEVGTVFGGKSQLDLTLGELLRKKAKF